MGIQDRDFELRALKKFQNMGKSVGGNGDWKLRKNHENPESRNLKSLGLTLNSQGVLFTSVTFCANDKEAENKKFDF